MKNDLSNIIPVKTILDQRSNVNSLGDIITFWTTFFCVNWGAGDMYWSFQVVIATPEQFKLLTDEQESKLCSWQNLNLKPLSLLNIVYLQVAIISFEYLCIHVMQNCIRMIPNAAHQPFLQVPDCLQPLFCTS